MFKTTPILEKLDKLIVNLLIATVCLIPLLFVPSQIATKYPLVYIYLFPKAILLRTGTLFLLSLAGLRLVVGLASRRFAFKLTAPDLLFGSFLALIWLSARFALVKKSALFGDVFWLEGLYTYENYFAIYLIGRVFATRDTVIALAKALVVVTVPIAAYAVVEGFYPSMQAFTNVGLTGRSGATAGNPVILGAFLTLPLPLIATLLISGRFGRGWSYPAVGSLSLGLIALVFTFSRGAWLGVGSALLALIAIVFSRKVSPKKPIAVALLATLLIAGSLAVLRGPGPIIPRAFSAFNPSEPTVAARLSAWGQAVGLMRRYPVWGTGIDSFAFASAKHYGAKSAQLDKPHNYFLELGSTVGIPALLVFLAFLGTVFSALLRAIKANGEDGYLALGISLSVVAYLTSTFFLFSTLNNGALFFGLIGIAMGWLAKENYVRSWAIGWRTHNYD